MKEDTEEKKLEELSTDEIWQNIGFHRPLAGFFYNLPLQLFTIVVGIFFTSFIYGYLYPFPDSMGYRTAAIGLFGLFFQLFDLGTANLMNRFIGETNVKNPQKMVEYIQYFIWYQMITGLIQITSVSCYALFYIPRTELAWGIWLMLIHSTTQYPGMLHIFKSTMETLQQFNKTAIIGFIQGEFFQRVTEIAFVIWGRYWGIAHPEIGEIMGIAIGATIGLYVDDFIAMVFSAYFFQKIMIQYGFTVKQCFRHDFDVHLLKECLVWGIKSGAPPMAWSIVSYTQLILWLTYVPQYTVFAALFSFAGGISSIINYNLNLGGSISESFMNGKEKLARYYVGQAWRYSGMIQFFMISIILVVINVLEPAFVFLGLDNYIIAIPFIIPRIVRDFQQPYNNFSSTVITSTGRINFLVFTQIFEAILALLSWYLAIVVFAIPQNYGFGAIIWLMPCAELPSILAKIFINYRYINNKIIKLQIPYYQTFIAPILSTIFIYILVKVCVWAIFTPILNAYGFLVAVIPILIIFIIIAPFFIYFPLTGLFGAWDDGTIRVLERATKISGLGKVLALPMFRILLYMSKHSKLHNRFAIDDSEALEEAKELMIIRNQKLEKKIEILK